MAKVTKGVRESLADDTINTDQAETYYSMISDAELYLNTASSLNAINDAPGADAKLNKAIELLDGPLSAFIN